LDNCEHVIAACAELAAELLSRSAATSVLATSREPLGVPGEITWRVPSLRCPSREQRIDVPTLSQYDAVKLFVERARRARPSFFVSDANAPAVAEICHRLDGIPLAIELAAARCRQMSAEGIAQELDDRFRLLTGGARTVLARQQTLAASLNWSHERLDEPERRAFRRLGVFAGPFPLEAAEAVVAAIDDVDPAAVFDLVSRLADRSLVVAEEGRHGEPRYRLLESLRAYALDHAATAGELGVIRSAHAAWWADWLQPRAVMPSDDSLEDVKKYHENIKAALDWSVEAPRLGLSLLERLGRVWHESGRAGDAMVPADRLLTAANAERYGSDWLAAAQSAAGLHFHARGEAAFINLVDRIENTARANGDEYHLALARYQKSLSDAEVVRDLARARRDVYVEAEATIAYACQLAEADPDAAVHLIEEATSIATASRNRYFQDGAAVAQAMAAQTTGELARCSTVAKGLLEASSPTWSDDAVRDLGFAALLTHDEPALRYAVEAGERAKHHSPGIASFVATAQHRLDLLGGQPSAVHPTLTSDNREGRVGSGWLWLTAREAIDAGAPDAAAAGTRTWAKADPYATAVTAAIEAAATGDHHRWHDALAIAVRYGFRLIAVDAIEGLAVEAARSESWTECMRLLGAALALRDETGYRWRFSFEERAVSGARAAAFAALGDDAAAAEAEGHSLEWREAAELAGRMRGERKRPRYGWASLTPTEDRVVALVAEGLTNPQIAERLFIGRATVKTHLEHIYTKLDVHTRAELAAQATRQRG
jgi:predicted ATPase/DNA-binding CsgD family transcriptional regulator